MLVCMQVCKFSWDIGLYRLHLLIVLAAFAGSREFADASSGRLASSDWEQQRPCLASSHYVCVMTVQTLEWLRSARGLKSVDHLIKKLGLCTSSEVTHSDLLHFIRQQQQHQLWHSHCALAFRLASIRSSLLSRKACKHSSSRQLRSSSCCLQSCSPCPRAESRIHESE